MIAINIEHLAKVLKSSIWVKSSLQNSRFISEILGRIMWNLLHNHTQAL